MDQDDQDRVRWWTVANKPPVSVRDRKFLYHLNDYQLIIRDSASWF